jgi:hypothetical protein
MPEETTLQRWQRETLDLLARRRAGPRAIHNVTALTYHLFSDPAVFDARFDEVACAFLMVRLACGDMPCTLVVNRVTPKVERFCAAHDVRIDCDRSLPGGLRCLSLDYIQRLHARFDTEYVLGVHGDGFPLRPGLEPFIGPYDYVGSPWGKPSWYTNLVFPYPKYCVGNGGLSVRSKRLCELASACYRRKYKLLPDCYVVIDDVFYSRVMPRFERACREKMAYAPPEVAGRFSFESNPEYYAPGGEMPFGFHTPGGFARVMNDFGDRVNAWVRGAE